MNNTIVTYETFHGSAKKIGEVISNNLDCNLINIDTPFEAEDLTNIDNIILVFNFRGPYTAQLTKLYLSRVKEQLKDKNIILVGEGIFSEKEFPIIADEINKSYPSKSFYKYFVKGELRVDKLFKEERALLNKFSELTKMDIKDMGELDVDMANDVADKIKEIINSDNNDNAEIVTNNDLDKNDSQTKWVCQVCGYVHYGEIPPEVCPICGVNKDKFTKSD